MAWYLCQQILMHVLLCELIMFKMLYLRRKLNSMFQLHVPLISRHMAHLGLGHGKRDPGSKGRALAIFKQLLKYTVDSVVSHIAGGFV